MRRLLTIFFVLLGFQEPTEYEREVGALPPTLLEGGCHNPGVSITSPEREQMVRRYAWSIFTSDAVRQVAEFVNGSAIDFGAGNGYLAYLLAKQSADVRAIDDWSWGKPDRLWHEVETGSYEKLADTSGHTLILSWPPARDPMALTALRAWNGTRLVYVGEIMRGTADPAFHDELARNWHLVERITIPQWQNRSDAIFLFERRDGAGDGWAWMKAELAKCTFDRSH
jgi:hypothetical protein